MTAQQRHLEELADRMDRGAAELRADAADPADTLTERGYDLPPERVADFGARHQAAADTAAAYAARLREQVAGGQPVTDAQLRQAEKVADAAELGGILIDGRRLTEASAERAWSESEREAILAYDAHERAAVEGSGQFTHIAEPGQVPFWQLGHLDQNTDVDEA